MDDTSQVPPDVHLEERSIEGHNDASLTARTYAILEELETRIAALEPGDVSPGLRTVLALQQKALALLLLIVGEGPVAWG